METEAKTEEIDSNLSEKRRNLLLGFDGHEVRNTTKLREGTGYPNNTVNYHTKLATESLVNQGLVEQNGVDETVSGEYPPNQYRITDRGQAVLNELRQEELDTALEITEYDVTVERVEKIEEKADWLEKRLDKLEEEKVDREEHDELVDRLKTDYWDGIIDAIERRTS